MHTEEDIRLIVAQTEEIEEAEEEMLYKVFDFADKEAHDVMVPRPEVVALSVDLPPEEALAAVIDSPYTRYPVYRGVARRHHRRPPRPRPLPRALRPRDRERRHRGHRPPGLRRPGDEGPRVAPGGVPPPEPAHGARCRRVRRRAGDRHPRGPAGGDRRRDRGRVRPAGRVGGADRRRHIRIDGTFTIDDFNEQFGTELPQEDYHTIAGFVFGELGRAPRRATRSSTTACASSSSRWTASGSSASRWSSSNASSRTPPKSLSRIGACSPGSSLTSSASTRSTPI